MSPEPSSPDSPLRLGPWIADRAAGELRDGDRVEVLEPKVAELLWVLAESRGEVVSRDHIIARLWPRVIVTDDSLARCVFKLRRALGDDSRAPRYVETLPKRGYRLRAGPAAAVEAGATAPAPRRYRWALAAGFIAACVALAGFGAHRANDTRVASLLDRAEDFYHQMTQAQNESALALYQQALSIDARSARAYAGLANVHVQRALRWPEGPATVSPSTNLRGALADGHLRAAPAMRELAIAERHAREAVRLDPHDGRGHKALGLVRAARGDFDAAIASYRRAIQLDADDWAPLIDLADVLEISGHPREALPWLEAAYAVMSRQREAQVARILPWYAATAVLIGDRHQALGDPRVAIDWYRRALAYAPMDADATAKLARVLKAMGDGAGAMRTCTQLRQVDARRACG